MTIADLRREYKLAELRREDLFSEPIAQFKEWFEQASGDRRSGRVRRFFVGLYESLLLVRGFQPTEVNAAVLATADQTGTPSARVVLLKGVDERGFLFFTNYQSRKGRELGQNPKAAMVFYWADQERQVTIAGTVAKLSAAESQAYFKSRPRGSRLGAWVSDQSTVIPDRATLEERLRELEKVHPGEEIPMPPYWGGYVLRPERIEFWQGGRSRLHDRFCYSRQTNQDWRIERLSP